MVTKEWVTCPSDALAAHLCLLETKHALMNCLIIRKCICEWYTCGGEWPQGHLSPSPCRQENVAALKCSRQAVWLEWAHFKGVHKSCCHASQDYLHPPCPPVTHPPTIFSFSLLSSSLEALLVLTCHLSFELLHPSFLPSLLLPRYLNLECKSCQNQSLHEEQGRGEVVVVIVNMYSPKTN